MKEANYHGLWVSMTNGTRSAFRRLSEANGEAIPAVEIDGRTFLALAKRGLVSHGGGYVHLTPLGRALKAHVEATRRSNRLAARRGRAQ